MFGMSFSEILVIAIIAVLVLGPDKLPSAMVQIAKFLKMFKKGINDAKGHHADTPLRTCLRYALPERNV